MKKKPSTKPSVPTRTAGYSGTPLPRKLGIKAGSSVVLHSAPDGFVETLGSLPEGVQLRHNSRAAADVTLVFVRSAAQLNRGIKALVARKDTAPAWIVWPKKTSPLAGEISEREVRGAGLAAGMVDYKICAVDEDWSGLLFSRKKTTSAP